MNQFEIKNTDALIVVETACIDGSTFKRGSLQRLHFEDINMAGSKIINANLSDLEIEGAQLGGAYLHNIGMPPEGHPYYERNAKQRPLLLEDCNFENSEIRNCNFSGVALSGCELRGMTIDGMLVDELIRYYHTNRKDSGS
jgi:uncharacterized protein YjbI with pentapeptide repeats